MQYVRTAPRTRAAIVTRSVATSPLIRTVYASRTRTIPVVYHPRYIVGRIASVRRNAIVIDPPTGNPVIVRDVVVQNTVPAIPVGSVVTLPVTYTNGVYQYVAPAYPAYSGYSSNAYSPYYGYAPQNGYAYAPPVYCNGNSSTALYAALLPAVVGMLTGNGSGLNSSDLASVALTAAAGGANTCNAYVPNAYYGQPAYGVPVNYGYTQTYAVPVSSYSAPYPTTYTTPYHNCLYSSDEDGDENGCATSSPYMNNGYNSYSSYAPYTPQQVQGIVVARSGDMLMVMGSGGTPTFVYAAPALQSGYTVNGPIAPGQIVDAYGYYNGNTFIATALM